MKITINARKVTVSRDLSDHIEKQLAKFDKFFPGEAEATVKLSRVRDIERVEVTIAAGPFLFRSEDESSTFMNALDCCMYSIERQIRKNKTRLKKKNVQNVIDFKIDFEVEKEDEGTEEDSTNTFKSKCKHYWSIISSWITKLILHWSKNSLLIDLLVYRTILILFVAYDMLCCLFYIIDYNNYI